MARKTTTLFLAVCGWMLVQVPARADDTAAKLFQSKCAACHAADGSGNTVAGKALKVVDLLDPEVQKRNDADLIAVVTKGKDKMPAYEKTLKADEIKSLVAYVRELANKK
jgi:mono/diheme cytochrome c family protein